jgi:hypothetical protein
MQYMELIYQFEFEKYTDNYNAVISLCNAEKKLLAIAGVEEKVRSAVDGILHDFW